MFLFKNTKSLVKRIGMNLSVYGFAGIPITILLIIFLPKTVAGYIYALTVIFSFALIIGLIISVVGFFTETVFITKHYKETDEQIKTRTKCSRCGGTFSKIEINNNKPYCYICSSYYSSKFNVIDGKLVDKESGQALLKEVILLSKPLHSCRGNIEPTDFIINLFTDKVEIIWGVGWCGGSSHADGAGGTEFLEANYFEKNTIDDFVSYLNSKPWGKDFVKWLNIKENKQIINLFCTMNKPIKLMTDFLQNENYDIEFSDDSMTIVKQTDDPWNHFNEFIAKADGVYNFIEVQMGGYDEKKRVSCCNFETACFLTLALFVSRENLHNQDALLFEIKKYANIVVENSTDYWRGQFIIDELISLIK